MFKNKTLIVLCLLTAFSAIVVLPLVASASTLENPDFRVRLSTKPLLLSEDDVRAEIQFGREMAARVLGRYGYYDDEELTRYLNLVASSLALNMNRPELVFRVAILKTDTINAYAAPGGYIFITRGALLQMNDEAELAAVIAHEMAHVTNRHIVRELNIHASDTSAVSGFTRFLGASGDPAKMAFLNLVDKAMGILFEDGYQIEDEKEADISAAMYLALSGYDPQALIDYLDRIEEIKGVSMEVLEKTHPAFRDRIILISEVIESEGLSEVGDNNRAAKRFASTVNIKPHELTDDDIAAEIRFGREMAARILGEFELLEARELNRYVTMVGMSLALNLNRPELDFRVAVLDTDEVASFSTPGGFVFLTKGLLARLEDEAELAAVIAHEMAHVAEKHIIAEVNIHGSDKTPSAGLARMVGTGDEMAGEALLNQADRAMRIITEQGYKYEDDMEADAAAVLLLAMAGYDPSAMVSYLESLELGEDETEGILAKTHPLLEERLKAVKEVIAEEGLDEGEFKRGAERFNEYKKSH